MMRIKTLWTIGIALGLLALEACSGSSKPAASAPETSGNPEMALSQKDTVAVLDLTHQFMTAVKEQRYADAVGMLYELSMDKPYDEPELLDNEQLEATLQTVKAFRVYDYDITDYRFKIAYDNEVRCKVAISPVEESSSERPITLVWSFKPVRYLGEWKLCFRNTNQGDRRFEP